MNCSIRLKNSEALSLTLSKLGFKLVSEYSGQVTSGKSFNSEFFTLEKIQDVGESLESITEKMSKAEFDALKFRKLKSSLKDQRKVIRNIELNGKTLDINLNIADSQIAEVERIILEEGDSLKSEFGGLENIPRDTVLSKGYMRIKTGRNYILFKKLESANGYVVVK